MVNIDDRIFTLMPSVITPNEFVIMVLIAKRINAKGTSWPSRKRLMKETGFGKNKVSSIVQSLSDKKLITKTQRRINKQKFTSNIYKLNIKGLSVYIPVGDVEFIEEEEQKDDGIHVTENRDTIRKIEDSHVTDFRDTRNRPLSIKQSPSLEVLNNNLSLDGGNKNLFFETEQKIFDRISSSPVYSMNRSKFYPDLTDEDIRGHHRTLCTDPEYVRSHNQYSIFEGKMKAQNAMKLRLLAEEAKRKADQERIEANKRRQAEYDQILERRKEQTLKNHGNSRGSRPYDKTMIEVEITEFINHHEINQKIDSYEKQGYEIELRMNGSPATFEDASRYYRNLKPAYESA